MEETKKPKPSKEYDVKHVRMGNWLEEYSRKKSMVSVYRNLRKKKQLNLQAGVSPLFNQLLCPILLKCGENNLNYGSIVQFMCDGQVLSIVVKDEDYNKFIKIPTGSFLTTSKVTKPCIRNSFFITNPWKDVKDGEIVNYGDDFALSTVNYPGVPKLYAGADYPFGTLTLKPGHSLLRVSSYPDSHCRFRIEHTENPSLSEGTPIPLKEPFHLMSSATHRNMVTNKKCKVLSILGLEQEVSFYYTPDWFTKYDKDNLINLWVVNSQNIV